MAQIVRSKSHPKLEPHYRQNKSSVGNTSTIHDPLTLRHLIFNIVAPVCQQFDPLSHQDLKKLYDQIMTLRRNLEDSMTPKLSAKFDYYEVP